MCPPPAFPPLPLFTVQQILLPRSLFTFPLFWSNHPCHPPHCYPVRGTMGMHHSISLSWH
jgi:hypothetical protein